MKEGDLELLNEMVKFEESHDMEKEYKIGWGWRHVRVWPATLSRLFKDGYLETVFRSNSFTGYRLSEFGRKVAAGAKEKEAPQTQIKLVFSEDLFQDIIGHDEVKELLRGFSHGRETGTRFADRTAGPGQDPISMGIFERVCGEKAIWLVGSATSKAGLWDLVAERQPQILLVDEMDKMNAADTAALLSMMEGGAWLEQKSVASWTCKNTIWVIAATNRLDHAVPGTSLALCHTPS